MTEDDRPTLPPKPFGSPSILVFHPNPRMHRPDAHRWTRGFALKDLRFP
jgi:hypothetical protein